MKRENLMPPNKICEVCSTYVDCDWILNRVEYDGMLRLKGGADSARRLVGYLDSDLLVTQFDFFWTLD